MDTASLPVNSISIVIPSYNAAKFIAETLQSALAQEPSPSEIIVIDDGSSDGTPEIVEELAQADRRVRLIRQPNGGVSRARNAGLATVSDGAWSVLFLDHDDILLPGALARLTGALAGSDQFSAAHGIAQVITEGGAAAINVNPVSLGLRRLRLSGGGNGWLSALAARPQPCADNEPTTFETLVYSSCVTSPGQMLIRRSALEQTGGFDPATAPSDDWDLLLRLSRIGPMAYVPQPVLGWRRHDANASRDTRRMKQSSYAARSNLLAGQMPLTSAQLATVRRQFAYTAATTLAGYVISGGQRCNWREDVWPALRLFGKSLRTNELEKEENQGSYN